MTAVLETPNLLGTCNKPWCLADGSCSTDDEFRLHEGRYSSTKGTIGGQLNVCPAEAENPDGSVHSGPLVVLSLSDDGQHAVELNPDTARAFSRTLADYADELAEVGDVAAFASHEFASETAVVQIEQLEQTWSEIGNGRLHYITCGVVKLTIGLPGEQRPRYINLDRDLAADLARVINAVAREVTR